MESVSAFSSYNFMANSPKRGSGSRSGFRLHGSSPICLSHLIKVVYGLRTDVPALSLKKRRRRKRGGGARCGGGAGRREEEEGRKIKEKQEDETAEIK